MARQGMASQSILDGIVKTRKTRKFFSGVPHRTVIDDSYQKKITTKIKYLKRKRKSKTNKRYQAEDAH